MSIRSLYGLAAAGILLCSCQSNTYQIDGFARSFAEGDTICLMKEGGEPIAISTVSNGKFSFYGEIRETGLYSVMAKKAPACQVSFFTEPGTITIELNLSADVIGMGETVTATYKVNNPRTNGRIVYRVEVTGSNEMYYTDVEYAGSAYLSGYIFQTTFSF